MKLLKTLLFLTYILACSTKKEVIRGHWHETVNGTTIHCYHISDTLVSVDEFTYGYSRRVMNGEIFGSMVANSTFELLKGRKFERRIMVTDTVIWEEAADSYSVFLDDLSLGLEVKVEPPELNAPEFDLPNDTLAAWIFIGKRKGHHENPNEYLIQFNGLIISTGDMMSHVCCRGNGVQLAVLDADKGTPKELLTAVVNEIQKIGFGKNRIYKTAINKEKFTKGLIRFM